MELTPDNDRGLRESELRALLDVVRAGYDDEPGDVMPNAVLQGLAKLIPCASVSFLELDLGRQVVLTDQEAGGSPVPADQVEALDMVFWAEYRNCLLCSYPDAPVICAAWSSSPISTPAVNYTPRPCGWATTGRRAQSTRCWHRCQPRPGMLAGFCSPAAQPIPTSAKQNGLRWSCCDPTCMLSGKTLDRTRTTTTIATRQPGCQPRNRRT